jgi:uncharacterized alkaline shock family protein YloU
LPALSENNARAQELIRGFRKGFFALGANFQIKRLAVHIDGLTLKIRLGVPRRLLVAVANRVASHLFLAAKIANSTHNENFIIKTLACQVFYVLEFPVAPHTTNLYGKITITKRAIEQVALAAAREVYGVARVKQAKVDCADNKIDVAVKLMLRFGISIDPAIESARSRIKYDVENFTGMTVGLVNIDVLGIAN